TKVNMLKVVPSGIISKMKQKRFAYMVILKNENAFTFISLLVSMTILFMVIQFISYLIKSLDISDNYEALSVRHFFYYMSDEVANAVGYSVKYNTMTLELDNRDR